jgi:LemA protein
MKSTTKKAGLALLAVVITTAAGASSVSYRELQAAKSDGAQAWSEVARIHAQRARTASVALDAAARPGGLDLAQVEHTRRLLARAAAMPTTTEVLHDPKAVDTYKQYQGELTGALFRLVGTAQSLPMLAGEASLGALRAELPRDEQALAQARARYKQAAVSYNAVAAAFPGMLVAAISGCQALPAGL